MIKTRGLKHINLNVTSLERSLRFYQQVFGLQETFRDGPTMVFLTTPGANDVVTLHQVDKPIGPAGIDHFGFDLEDKNDLDSAVREVEKAGGKLLRRGEHSPGHPFAYVEDPDGYVIEL